MSGSRKKYLDVDQRGDVFCVRFRQHPLDEIQIYEMAKELIGLAGEEGCRKLALSLGPGSPVYLYSVFLAKMYTVQRTYREQGGTLVLCEVDPQVMNVFETCGFGDKFTFAADFDEAVALLGQSA
jgi:hypothetical protein